MVFLPSNRCQDQRITRKKTTSTFLVAFYDYSRILSKADSISGAELLQAMDDLRGLLGRSIVDLIIRDLQAHGISMDREARYSMGQIEEVLRRTFSQDGASLLAKRLQATLAK
jgi:hypothetical protein